MGHQSGASERMRHFPDATSALLTTALKGRTPQHHQSMVKHDLYFGFPCPVFFGHKASSRAAVHIAYSDQAHSNLFS